MGQQLYIDTVTIGYWNRRSAVLSGGAERRQRLPGMFGLDQVKVMPTTKVMKFVLSYATSEMLP